MTDRLNLQDIRDLASGDKVRSFDEMPALIYNLKLHGQRVVLAQGVFDVLHLGHSQYLEAAARHGFVVVGVENDDAVRLNKGPTRPINSLRERMLSVAAFRSVGFVFGYKDALAYDDSAAYVERYRALCASVAIPFGDPNTRLKARQAVEAEVDTVLIFDKPQPNSTTQMLSRIGYPE